MANIYLKQHDGTVVEHDGTLPVGIPKEDGELQIYTPGVPVSKTVELDFSNGDMDVKMDEGEVATSVEIKKPENLVASNIREGIQIAGVGPGTFVGRDIAGETLDSLFNKTIAKAISPTAGIVPSSAFYSCSELSIASFPLCSKIQDNAFRHCVKLSEIYFPECEYIGGSAFAGYGMSSSGAPISVANFPKCSLIGSSAFYNCGNLQVVSFPVCTKICSGAFTNYNTYYGYSPKISVVDFPMVRNVDTYAFAYVKSLQTASFPECTIVAARAFIQCSKLKSLYTPKLQVIGSYAFCQCASLSEVSLPSCTAIGSVAFSSCQSLTSLYLLGSSRVVLYNLNTFSYTPIVNSTFTGSYGSIFVRESLLSAYMSASYWSALSSRIVGLTDDQISQLQTQ